MQNFKNEDIIDEVNYLKVLDANAHHLEKLITIVKDSGEFFEGNYMYYKNTFTMNIDQLNKQRNLYSIANLECVDVGLEIGFNAGHSALIMLLSNPKLKLYCFDICEHSYTKPCFLYLQSIFGQRIQLFDGDSLKTIPEFRKNNPEMRFDLIHLDGCHLGNVANCDFFNTLTMSKQNGILLFDDIYIPVLHHMYQGFIADGHITPITSILLDGTYPHAVAIYNKQY